MTHCYITSKSKKVFIFIFDYLKHLFFYDCQSFNVIVDHFALNLSTVMTTKRIITLTIKDNVEAIRELAEFDIVNTKIKL